MSGALPLLTLLSPLSPSAQDADKGIIKHIKEAGRLVDQVGPAGRLLACLLCGGLTEGARRAQ